MQIVNLIRGLFMANIKSKIPLLLFLCLITGLLSPVVTHAEEVNSWGGDSGRIDAGKAAEQRAAAAKRAAKKQKKDEERKAAEAQKDNQPQNEKPVTQ
jgi:hypothetical protein